MKKSIGNLNRRAFLQASIAATGGVLPLRTILGQKGGDPSHQAELALQPSGVVAIKNENTFNKTIPTATGNILPNDMGITSVHEHVPIPKDPAERDKSLSFAITELEKARQLGLQTIVAVGPTEDVRAIREVSAATKVNIICCTGFYVLKDEQQTFGEKDFARHMTDEIENGIQGSDIKPGVIKVATRALPLTQAEINLLTAAAKIQKQHGLPMCIHSVTGCAEQQLILEKGGANLEHCYFSHVEATFGWSGRNVDQEIDYLEGVVKKGSTLCFNNFGNWNHTKPEDLARIITQLTRRGYDDKMVATMDLIWSFENSQLKILWEDTNEGGKDRTYSYLIRKVVPWLKENNVSQSTIDKLIVDNPRKLFTAW
ncbi:MAG TPA: hypothetical protein VF141_10925 [Chryseolinea sp.]